jgi:hypothetical protein
VDANMRGCILVGWVFLGTAMNSIKQDFLPILELPLPNPLYGVEISSPLELDSIKVSHLEEGMAYWNGKIITQEEFYDELRNVKRKETN